ncbi:hypothetical protein EVAR_77085_1 [Eumeta japonica]|uniref:Uncharacterized protein n=1 Tax=Eumeta variegata TaxID=151549 RepID=A0A4C1T1S6_EUMVA|nr:hypothetical protein EVAR_77085_1 [Eumeta japonica]
MPSVAVVALSSDSIRARAQCRPTRSNNIFVRATAARAAILSLSNCSILVEPIRGVFLSRRVHISVRIVNVQLMQDFGFAYLPLEGQVLHRMRRLHSERRLGRISYPHASHKLPRRSCPGELPLKFSFVPWSHVCVDDVPVSDDRLVGAPIDVSLLLGCVHFARSCNTLAVHLQVQFFNLQSLTVPNSSYEVPETRICSIRGWKTGRVGGPLDSGHAQSQGLSGERRTSCNGDFRLSPRKPAPGLPLTMRTLLSMVGGFLAVAAWSIMDSVFFRLY